MCLYGVCGGGRGVVRVYRHGEGLRGDEQDGGMCLCSCGEGLRDGAWVNQGEAKRVEEMNQKKLYCVEGGEGVCPHRYI